jgi:hypothetical protein
VGWAFALLASCRIGAWLRIRTPIHARIPTGSLS